MSFVLRDLASKQTVEHAIMDGRGNVDLNSYFASIEQELCPELRGQPIAIVPIRVEAQTGCCIAVSY
jgi:hypothetical protein